MNLTKIRKGFKPKVIKIEISDDGFSVLVKDKKSDFEAWLDAWIEKNDILVEWNQYIFCVDDENDMFAQEMQNDEYINDISTSTVINYLEHNNKIIQDKNGNWSYSIN